MHLIPPGKPATSPAQPVKKTTPTAARPAAAGAAKTKPAPAAVKAPAEPDPQLLATISQLEEQVHLKLLSTGLVQVPLFVFCMAVGCRWLQ